MYLAFVYVCYSDRGKSSGQQQQYARIQYECIRCLKAIMNNTVGLRQMFSHREALAVVARSLDARKPAVMAEACKVLAAVSLVPPDGHERALEALTISHEISSSTRSTAKDGGDATVGHYDSADSNSSCFYCANGGNRFRPVVQGLMRRPGVETLRVGNIVHYFFLSDDVL